MILIQSKYVFVVLSVLLLISLVVPLSSKNIERKKRDISVKAPFISSNSAGMMIYKIEPYSIWKKIMNNPNLNTRNLQRSVSDENNSYINYDLERNGQVFSNNMVSEQSNIRPVTPIAISSIDVTENLIKENDLHEQIMQINKTIDKMGKEYVKIKNDYDKLKEFQESNLNSDLQNNLEMLSLSFKNQTGKVNDALVSLQFQIDIIRGALLELIVAVPIYSNLYSYQDPAFFPNEINYQINKNDTLVPISGRSIKNRYQNNLEKPELIFKFYVLIDKLENDFNELNKILNINENKSTSSFDLETLNKTMQKIILDSKGLKNQFLALPMDHNANITKKLYNLIDKLQNDIQNMTKSNFTIENSEIQKLLSNLKIIQQNYLQVYSINFDLKTKNHEISQSIFKILSILHSIVENTDDFNESIRHMKTEKLKIDQKF